MPEVAGRAWLAGRAEVHVLARPERGGGSCRLGEGCPGNDHRAMPDHIATVHCPGSGGTCLACNLRRPSPRARALQPLPQLEGHAPATRSLDWMRLTPAFSMLFHAAASEPWLSMPRQASSMTNALR